MDNNNNNYPYSTYPDSNTSTPRSREVDSCETASYGEQQQQQQLTNNNLNGYKVKLMCSYGGKILPRPHDNQLTYIGGDTKILTVDRNIRYASISTKLHSLTDSTDVCFKYQLPGEDLDALISVTNDEDLEHMMTEYDRIYRTSVKPVRLRLFMFSLSPSTYGGDNKTEQQWFVDALNAVQISSAQNPSPAQGNNPDYLFGFDKGSAPVAVPVQVPAPVKVQDVSTVVVAQANVSDGARPGSECGSEDSNSNSNSNCNRHVMADPVVSPTVEIRRQMQEYQMMQIAASHDQAINIDPRTYYGEYYTQKIHPAAAAGQPRYWQEQRHMTSGGYQMPVAGNDSPVYLISSSTGVYPSPSPTPVAAPGTGQTLRPATQVGQSQTYYGMQRVVNPPEFYREQQAKVGTCQETIGMVRPQVEIGYGQVYYTTSQGGMTPGYQPVVAVNQEGKMVVNPNS
ncbi:uncharacterized protein LOC143594876 [Bidens hawaiensis]|uniref:uncharacterized protein LOC143594876 n=1 Tax=Bidens hawaiensis TaxID=980011 RepID=UPI00404B6004